MYLRFLLPRHFEAWQKGHEDFRTLEKHLQVGPAKFDHTRRHFADWVKERGLVPVLAPYSRRTLQGVEPLQITLDGNPEREKLYHTRYAPANLSERKARALTQKLSKAPDLVVFQKVSEEGNCSECGAELNRGDLLFMESNRPLCLGCADLDHLVFLPAGDLALTRRARKHSPLSAVVVRFNRPRKRYERQGVLVAPEALAKAEEECTADAPERAARRAEAAVQRVAEDRDFIQEMTGALLKQFPNCPPTEARAIAEHTAVRGSGRVGRSAAGRALDPQALELALRAHIRHGHTPYDTLLMQGVARQEAREQIRAQVERVVATWSVR